MKKNRMLSYFLALCMILSSVAFAVGGGGGGGSDTFNIDDSYSDVFTSGANGCRDVLDLRWNLSGRAFTVANRAAAYIAADVQLYADGRFRGRPDDLAERNGPLSSVQTETITVSLTCALLLNNSGQLSTEARGWHKANAQSNDPDPGRGSITITTSDRIRI